MKRQNYENPIHNWTKSQGKPAMPVFLEHLGFANFCVSTIVITQSLILAELYLMSHRGTQW